MSDEKRFVVCLNFCFDSVAFIRTLNIDCRKCKAAIHAHIHTLTMASTLQGLSPAQHIRSN